MNIYEYKTNLKNKFISYLLEWNGSGEWSPIGPGCPQLCFDFHRQELCLKFTSIDSIGQVRNYLLSSFKFSIQHKNSTITIDLNDNSVDIALSFSDYEQCAKFRVMLIHYLHLSELIREANG